MLPLPGSTSLTNIVVTVLMSYFTLLESVDSCRADVDRYTKRAKGSLKACFAISSTIRSQCI